MAVAEQVIEKAVHAKGIQEIVADKNYHSNQVLRTVAEPNVGSAGRRRAASG